MREFTVGPNDAGQRLDRWLAKNPPPSSRPPWPRNTSASSGQAQRQGAKRDTRLAKGDLRPALHQRMSFSTPPPRRTPSCRCSTPQLDILYEDENLLLVNKRPGLVVHPDEGERVNTSSPTSEAYLYQKNGVEPLPGARLTPPPCATALTGTPAASSSPPRTPRPCGS